MAGYEVLRMLQNPLGLPAAPGQRDDFVRVINGCATVELDPVEFERMSETGLLRTLAEFDTRPMSVISVSTPTGGRGVFHQRREATRRTRGHPRSGRSNLQRGRRIRAETQTSKKGPARSSVRLVPGSPSDRALMASPSPRIMRSR